ncbi:hypothetical protein EYF80_007555 [Liparis tanakae]|uniref:Uncharacterized protein n=1 Tax=Liparis tanakae TaxID=230148 RepID=A0A4Z2IWP5_9TELE|nr:hypothetical protein EYF80_007555 [Liparis tanakae]
MAGKKNRWGSSRGTVNCIFLGLPVSMVALSVKEEDRMKRKRRRRENPYEERRSLKLVVCDKLCCVMDTAGNG